MTQAVNIAEAAWQQVGSGGVHSQGRVFCSGAAGRGWQAGARGDAHVHIRPVDPWMEPVRTIVMTIGNGL